MYRQGGTNNPSIPSSLRTCAVLRAVNTVLTPLQACGAPIPSPSVLPSLLAFAPLFSALGPTHPFFLIPPLSPLHAEMWTQKGGCVPLFALLITCKGRWAQVNG